MPSRECERIAVVATSNDACDWDAAAHACLDYVFVALVDASMCEGQETCMIPMLAGQ